MPTFNYDRTRREGPTLTAHLDDIYAQRRQELNNRLQLQEFVGKMKSDPQSQGALGKVNQINSYDKEAVVGELITDLLIFLFQFCFNIPYLQAFFQFNALQKKELESLIQGRPVRLVYQADGEGKFPDIYPLNAKGEVAVEETPLPSSEITDFLIRKNGYVPRPSYFKGLEDAMNLHIEAMLGSNVLSQEQLIRLHGALSQHSQNQQQSERPAPGVIGLGPRSAPSVPGR